MTRTYEAMFLLDNQVVREDWKRAKAIVTDLVAKHGGKIVTARHWGERKLAYPVKKKNRASYLLTYCELDGLAMPSLTRDLELSEQVLRYLITRRDGGVPEGEVELAAAEDTADFSLPEPPSDDHVEEEPEPRSRGRRDSSDDSREGRDAGDSKPKKASEDGDSGDGDSGGGDSGGDGEKATGKTTEKTTEKATLAEEN